MIDILSYLALWSFIGAILFSVFMVFVFRSGVVYTSRKEDGTLKEKIPFTGMLIMVAFILTIVGYLVAANYFGLVRQGVFMGFESLFWLNFALYLILFLYDTIFIDGFVLGYWRPGFLQLSDQLGRDSMGEHILKSIRVVSVVVSSSRGAARLFPSSCL